MMPGSLAEITVLPSMSLTVARAAGMSLKSR